MKPGRVDFFVDLAYGLLIFLAVVFIFTGETTIGIAFGLGALVSYAIHVTWKMARFDPEWMTKEMTENIEETLTEEVTEEVTESVEEKVTESVEEKVTEEVAQEVTENVERALSAEIDSIIQQLEEVNQRIDKQTTKGDPE